MAVANTGSIFTQGSQSAKEFGSKFSEITVLVVTLTTSGTSGTVAHGLTAAPDFVVASLLGGEPAGLGQNGVAWTADATTITVSTQNTLANSTRKITMIAGVRA